MLIGLSGKKQSGKDTFADYLQEITNVDRDWETIIF